MKRIYTNAGHPAGFSGFEALLKEAQKRSKKITKEDVRHFLHSNRTYTLHYPIRQRVQTGRTRCSWIDSDHQADLCVVSDIAPHNKGIDYILVVVDVLSRFAWCAAVKRKTGELTAAAYEEILAGDKRIPFRLYTDAGKEFIAKEFQQVLMKNGIEHRIPKNHDVKCGFAENFIRRLKSRMYKFFTENGTKRWIEVLPELVRALNATPNKSTGLAACEITKENAAAVWDRLYAREKLLTPKHKFQPGDRVRLALKGQLFRKGYKHTYTEEVFVIHKRIFKDPPAYIIKDLSGEEIDSIVYEQELIGYEGKV